MTQHVAAGLQAWPVDAFVGQTGMLYDLSAVTARALQEAGATTLQEVPYASVAWEGHTLTALLGLLHDVDLPKVAQALRVTAATGRIGGRPLG